MATALPAFSSVAPALPALAMVAATAQTAMRFIRGTLFRGCATIALYNAMEIGHFRI